VNVRQDIHAALGRPSLATIADLHSYLKAVKANDFRTSGAKVYPLGLDWRLEWLPVIANLWGGRIDKSLKYLDEKTGEVKFYLRSEAAYESLKWLNSLYHEGLIDPENFSYQLQQRDEAYNSGKFAVVFGYFFDLWDPNRVLQSQNSEMFYAAVDAPQGTPGVPALMDSYSVLGWNVAAITKNCSDPEAAMRFFDFYMSEEGQILSFYGIEGETWEMQDGKPMLLPGVYEAKIADWDGYGQKTGVRYLDLNQSQKYNWEKDMEIGQRKADRAIATKYGFNGTDLSQLVLDGKSDAGKAFANIEASLLAEVTRLVLVDDPNKFDAKYREVMGNFETLKLALVEQEWNRLYNR
jgi:putative aldouronate transport system substrate-binding protein